MKLSRKLRALVSAVGLVPITFVATMFGRLGHPLYGLGVELFAAIVYAIWVSLAEPEK